MNKFKIKKIVIFISFLFAILQLLYFNLDSSREQEKNQSGEIKRGLLFETIKKGSNAADISEKNVKITYEAAWIGLWEKMHSNMIPTPKAPAINFNEEMVVGVFSGSKSSGGYGIEVKEVIDEGEILKINILETEPGKNCMTSAVITSPYHLIKIPVTKKEILFHKNKKIINCE